MPKTDPDRIGSADRHIVQSELDPKSKKSEKIPKHP